MNEQELIKLVEQVLEEKRNHIYSVSRIYAAYNAAFNLKEELQSCASCLKVRADKLEKWNAERTRVEPIEGDVPRGEVYTIKAKSGEEVQVIFDGEKANLLNGSKPTAGTYEMQDGGLMAIQPGGKATIKKD